MYMYLIAEYIILINIWKLPTSVFFARLLPLTLLSETHQPMTFDHISSFGKIKLHLAVD